MREGRWVTHFPFLIMASIYGIFDMDLSFGEIQCFVSDLAVAKTFYAGALGLNLIDEGDNWLLFDIGGIELMVMGMARPGRLKEVYGAECSTVLCLKSEDIQQDYATLQSKGIHFFSEVTEVSPGKYYVAFQDPDGNLLELIQK